MLVHISVSKPSIYGKFGLLYANSSSVEGRNSDAENTTYICVLKTVMFVGTIYLANCSISLKYNNNFSN